MEMWFDLTDQMTVMGVTWTKENHTLSSFHSEQTRISSLERHLRKLADSVGKFCCCNPALVALKVFFSFHITRHRHQVLLGQVFILLGRLFRSVFLGKKTIGSLRFCPIYWSASHIERPCVCVYTANNMQSKYWFGRGVRHDCGTALNEATTIMGYWVWSTQRTCIRG